MVEPTNTNYCHKLYSPLNFSSRNFFFHSQLILFFSFDIHTFTSLILFFFSKIPSIPFYHVYLSENGLFLLFLSLSLIYLKSIKFLIHHMLFWEIHWVATKHLFQKLHTSPHRRCGLWLREFISPNYVIKTTFREVISVVIKEKFTILRYIINR
jgi:hypothetical protein